MVAGPQRGPFWASTWPGCRWGGSLLAGHEQRLQNAWLAEPFNTNMRNDLMLVGIVGQRMVLRLTIEPPSAGLPAPRPTRRRCARCRIEIAAPEPRRMTASTPLEAFDLAVLVNERGISSARRRSSGRLGAM